MAEPTTKTGTDPATDSAKTWLGSAGLVLVAIGLLGAVVMWSEMASEDVYSATDKWLAVLAALLVSGVGLLALGLAAVLGRMPNR